MTYNFEYLNLKHSYSRKYGSLCFFRQKKIDETSYYGKSWVEFSAIRSMR